MSRDFPLSLYFREPLLANKCLDYFGTEELNNLRLVSKNWDSYVMAPHNHNEFWAGKPKPFPTPTKIRWENPFCWAQNREYFLPSASKPRNMVGFYRRTYHEDPTKAYMYQIIFQFWVVMLPTFTTLFGFLFALSYWLFFGPTAGWLPFFIWLFSWSYSLTLFAVYIAITYYFIFDSGKIHEHYQLIWDHPIAVFPLMPAFSVRIEHLFLLLWSCSMSLVTDTRTFAPFTLYREIQDGLYTLCWEWVLGLVAIHYPLAIISGVALYWMIQRPHPQQVYQEVRHLLFDDFEMSHTFFGIFIVLVVLLACEVLAFLIRWYPPSVKPGDFFRFSQPIIGPLFQRLFLIKYLPEVKKWPSYKKIHDLGEKLKEEKYIWILNYYNLLYFFFGLLYCVYVLYDEFKSFQVYVPPWARGPTGVCKSFNHPEMCGLEDIFNTTM